MSKARPLHVVAAILRDRQGRVLICQRPAGKPQAGRLEFPGGKCEPDELPEVALRRELREELGIVAGPLQPLIQVHHAYPEFSVFLDVFEVVHFGGFARPLEGQSLRWLPAEALPAADILEADHAIIQALRLPEQLLITPEPLDRRSFIHSLEYSLQRGVRMVQLRAKTIERREYVSLAHEVLAVCRQHDARLLLNAEPEILREVDADGIHLDRRQLRLLHQRPISHDKWLSAACHNIHELELASRIQADFILASPLRKTLSHPDAMPMGFPVLQRLIEMAPMPVYALGGMTTADLPQVRRLGGQGIAAISALWGKR